jgi:hypothetical protein
MPTASDLDTLLEALDRADTAVRALYRQLADDPDLAAEYDAELRDSNRSGSSSLTRSGSPRSARGERPRADRETSLEKSGARFASWTACVSGAFAS